MPPNEQPTPTLSSFLYLPGLTEAREAAAKTREELDQFLTAKVPGYSSEDTSLVVFGSLARGEWTAGSDLDWTYLIDGQANSDHLAIAQEIEKVLAEAKRKFRPPGRTGTFGNMTFSHDVIHQIGGQNDTNKNTTQRILLLLESVAIGRGVQAHERVVRGVINRYVEEDSHLLTTDSKAYRVPRFLLNDIVRFWRTMAVDFASKQRDRAGEGWGLRNAKLRMSRKLIFASGLLVCFGCHLDLALRSKISTDPDAIKLNLVNYIRDSVRLSPLQTIAQCLSRYDVPQMIAAEFFNGYDSFLRILGDAGARASLETLRSPDSRTDPLFQDIRAISKSFEHALDNIFFENPEVGPLTRKYAVF